MNFLQKGWFVEGLVVIFSIGIVVFFYVYEMGLYVDYYFDEINCNYKLELKVKFKCICDKMYISKCYMVVWKEFLV